MRISDWSSDVCSSDLTRRDRGIIDLQIGIGEPRVAQSVAERIFGLAVEITIGAVRHRIIGERRKLVGRGVEGDRQPPTGIEIGRAHSELQSLMRISYAVFCLKKKKYKKNNQRIQ